MMSIVRPAAVVLAALAFVGCEDMGVSKAANIPLEVAREQPPKPLVEQTLRISPEPPVAIAEEPVQVGGQWWQASGTEYTLPTDSVRPVGSRAGLTFYAFAWDEAPFDRLLVERGAGAWQEFLEVY